MFVMDVLTAGRVAHGERWASDVIDSDLAISKDEVEVFRDRLVLDPAQGDLAQRMGRFDAIGTIVFFGPALAAEAEHDRQSTADRGRAWAGNTSSTFALVVYRNGNFVRD